MATAGRGSDQFPVRMPEGMRAEIKAAAKANGRSMNSEILARLDGPQTLRDWFAGQAISGLIAAGFDKGETVRLAYATADAMLAERAKIGASDQPILHDAEGRN